MLSRLKLDVGRFFWDPSDHGCRVRCLTGHNGADKGSIQAGQNKKGYCKP